MCKGWMDLFGGITASSVHVSVCLPEGLCVWDGDREIAPLMSVSLCVCACVCVSERERVLTVTTIVALGASVPGLGRFRHSTSLGVRVRPESQRVRPRIR